MPEGRARPEVVVTADDLGWASHVDDAIFAAARDGVVTSTAVLPTGPTFALAARRTRALRLDCGVHFDLVSGSPLSNPSAVRRLVEGGCFRGSPAAVLAGWARGRLSPADVAREWERQIERVLEAGIAPSHLSGHYHLHLVPGWAPIALDLARRYGIASVRLPDEPPWWMPPGTAPVRGRLKCALLAGLAANATRLAGSSAGVRLTPCRGIAASGALGVTAWRSLLERLEPGPLEIVCHPGQGPLETEAARSPELRRAIDARADRCSFRDLAPSNARRGDELPIATDRGAPP